MNTKPIPPLRAIREARRLTIAQVSAATGIADTTLSQIERGIGNRSITPEMAEKLADFFGRDTINEMQLLYPERFVEAIAA